MKKEIIIELRRIMKTIEDVPEGSEDVELLDNLATDILNDLLSLVKSLEVTDAIVTGSEYSTGTC